MAEDYTTVANIKALMPQTTFATTYDALLTRIITMASRDVDAYLKREPGSFSVATETTRYFNGSGNQELWIGELAAVPSYVGVAEGGDVADAAEAGGTYSTYGSSDFLVWPYDAIAKKTPILRLDIDILNGSKVIFYKYPKAVKITGYFGFATTTNMPEDITLATEINVMRTFKRSQQAFEDASAMKDLRKMVYVKGIDPQAKEILDHQRFQWL